MGKIIIGLLFAFLVTGCASMGAKPAAPKTVNIEFKGKPGETSVTRYYSNARIFTFQDSQLLRDRTEGVEFSVTTRYTDFDPAKKIMKYSVRTTVKDGTVDLHDLAFPELNETLDYVARADGAVLKVSGLPPTSLFYVPALPTPGRPVEVGDTWEMEHGWVSSHDGIPLQLQIVAILKALVPCEGAKTCADIELSGGVNLAARPTVKGATFQSKLWGRVLFSIDRGDVIWSEMRSTEDMGVNKDHMGVRSCMVSEMKLPEDGRIKFDCNPSQDEISPTPKY